MAKASIFGQLKTLESNNRLKSSKRFISGENIFLTHQKNKVSRKKLSLISKRSSFTIKEQYIKVLPWINWYFIYALIKMLVFLASNYGPYIAVLLHILHPINLLFEQIVCLHYYLLKIN